MLYKKVDYDAVNFVALQALSALLGRWLPDGRISGREYIALNPRRADRSPGSFKINIQTGRWADWACGATGGDPVSLAAYLFGLSQPDAAHRLAVMLGIRAGGER